MGGRVLFLFVFITVSFSFLAVVFAGHSKTARVPDSPPVAEPKPVVDYFHGTRVIDNYRWLEKSDSPETRKWVESENEFTRALLDPLPGRDALHKRLTELLSIGNVTAPVIAGRHYFY